MRMFDSEQFPTSHQKKMESENDSPNVDGTFMKNRLHQSVPKNRTTQRVSACLHKWPSAYHPFFSTLVNKRPIALKSYEIVGEKGGFQYREIYCINTGTSWTDGITYSTWNTNVHDTYNNSVKHNSITNYSDKKWKMRPQVQRLRMCPNHIYIHSIQIQVESLYSGMSSLEWHSCQVVLFAAAVTAQHSTAQHRKGLPNRVKVYG